MGSIPACQGLTHEISTTDGHPEERGSVQILASHRLPSLQFRSRKQGLCCVPSLVGNQKFFNQTSGFPRKKEKRAIVSYEHTGRSSAQARNMPERRPAGTDPANPRTLMMGPPQGNYDVHDK
jgi:hypothetical protein